MSRSLAATIQAANTALLANGNLDAVGEFFTPDYVAHLTDQDMKRRGFYPECSGRKRWLVARPVHPSIPDRTC
jgi:hypothetical protein